MNREGTNMKRKSLLAAVMGLIMPGMGQAYNGERVKGASFFIIFLAVNLIGFRSTVLLPDRLLIFGVIGTIAATLAVYSLAVVDAWRGAKRSETALKSSGFRQWYFYLAAWLLGSVLILGAVFAHVRDNYIEAFKIPSASMEPAVMRGDCVLADKTAYQRLSPKTGDIVIFIYPDDRSQRYIKRVEALPGDTITLPDGTRQEVPHGSVYVVGDNRDNSVDSRKFGFVPLRDVIAKVRQVYFSSGTDGVHWGRIGATYETD